MDFLNGLGVGDGDEFSFEDGETEVQTKIPQEVEIEVENNTGERGLIHFLSPEERSERIKKLIPKDNYLPSSASLHEQLDNGRKFVGILRIYDNFANLVVENSCERIYSGKYFCEVKKKNKKITCIRGENVLLLAELDDKKEKKMIKNGELVKKPVEEVRNLYKKMTKKEKGILEFK